MWGVQNRERAPRRREGVDFVSTRARLNISTTARAKPALRRHPSSPRRARLRETLPAVRPTLTQTSRLLSLLSLDAASLLMTFTLSCAARSTIALRFCVETLCAISAQYRRLCIMSRSRSAMVHDELQETVGEKVAGILVRAVTHVGGGGKALELTAVTAVNTTGLSPGLLLGRGDEGRARSGRARGGKNAAHSVGTLTDATPDDDGTPRVGNAPSAGTRRRRRVSETRIASFDSRGTHRDRLGASFGDAEA